MRSLQANCVLTKLTKQSRHEDRFRGGREDSRQVFTKLFHMAESDFMTSFNRPFCAERSLGQHGRTAPMGYTRHGVGSTVPTRTE